VQFSQTGSYHSCPPSQNCGTGAFCVSVGSFGPVCLLGCA
jgi:hypothetical protein